MPVASRLETSTKARSVVADPAAVVVAFATPLNIIPATVVVGIPSFYTTNSSAHHTQDQIENLHPASAVELETAAQVVAFW